MKHCRAVALVSSVMVACLQASALAGSRPSRSTQTSAAAPVLDAGSRVVRSLHGGERQTFPLVLARDEFVNVVVDQQGIDVIVRVAAPDGLAMITVDGPNGRFGPERVAWIAPAAATYVLEIVSPSTAASEGRYELRSSGGGLRHRST